jgi:hypothetical protein
MPRTMIRLSLVCLLVGLVGCAQEPNRRIETGGRDSLVTVDGVNIADYLEAADEMVASMLRSGQLQPAADGEPLYVEFDRVFNDTGDPTLVTEQITRRIRTAITNSGQARVLTPRGESRLQEEAMQQDAAAGLEAGPLPDYFLSGVITSVGAQVGRDRERTYTFSLALTDRQRVEVWSANRDITKAGSRPGVAF